MIRAVAAALLAVLSAGACAREPPPIVVGSKNFTEQVILGELLAELIEERAGLPVERRLDLGGTFVSHKALVAGELDVYVEYTGTALIAVLGQPPSSDPAEVFETVRAAYAERFGLTWMAPLGFNNSFALVVRPDDAERLGLTRISDLARVAGTFRAGFGYEFIERADGYDGLTRAYGFSFESVPREMDLGLLYRALEEGQVDVVAGSATDGLIDAMGLVVLLDDRRYFPPYDAAPVARAEILARHPELDAALRSLAGRIDAPLMRRANRAVDKDGRSHRAVAREILLELGLLPG